MLKMFGSMVTITASALLGACAAGELEASYQELIYLQKLIGMIQGEVRYSRAVLSHIFRKLGKELEAPYDVWMKQMSSRMEARKGGSLGSIWRESVNLYLGASKLPRRELRKLRELGFLLGDVDAQMELKVLEGYQKELSVSIEDMHREIQNKKKLCRCLGISGGILIAVLLV